MAEPTAPVQGRTFGRRRFISQDRSDDNIGMSRSLNPGIVTRITLLWTAVFVLGLAAFTALAWAGIVREQFEALDGDLFSTATLAATRIAEHRMPTPADLQHAAAPDASVVIIGAGRSLVVGPRIVTARFISRLATLPLDRGVTLTAQALRAYAVPLGTGAGARVVAVVSMQTLQDEQRRTGYGFGVAALPILVFAIVMGALLARRSLAPVETMRRVAAQIAKEGTLSRRLHLGGTDELARLAATFDDMLGRLEQSFVRERAFIGDVSHELRNALGAIIGEADFALAQSDDAQRGAHALTGIVARARRLSRTVDDLLLLARADAGVLPRAERADLNELAARVTSEVQLRDDGPPVTVCLSEYPVFVFAHSELLERVIDNLLVNARHAARSRVALTVSHRDDVAHVRVDDDGQGVPEFEREAIFRRFQRGDAAYAGAGLGLALVQAIVTAYGGTVRVERSRWDGASFLAELRRAE